jgi:hypothetical protein
MIEGAIPSLAEEKPMRQPLILSRDIQMMATVAIATSELRAQSLPEFLVLALNLMQAKYHDAAASRHGTGLRLRISVDEMTITTPAFSCDTLVASFLTLEWGAPRSVESGWADRRAGAFRFARLTGTPPYRNREIY